MGTIGLTVLGRSWLAASVGVALLVGAPASSRAAGEYRTIDVASLKIEFDSEWAMRTSPGYFPVRLDITNRGDARVIEIVGEGTRFMRVGRGMSGAETEIRQTVRLARGDRVRLTMPVPIFATNENIRFEIRENGTTLERLNYTGFQSGSPAADASVLIVADRASASGAVMAGWLRSAAGPAGTTVHAGGGGASAMGLTVRPGFGSMPPTDFVLPPARLPANWLGYTSLRAVVIGPTEWGQLADAQKNALLTWTACGGNLVFVDGELNTLLPQAEATSAPAGEGAARAYFFGRIHRPTSAAMTLSGLGAFLVRAQTLQDSNLALPANSARDWGTIAGRGFRLPVSGVNGVPARAYVSILLLFSVVIGPANYWLLRRTRQQVLLVLTAPLISLVFIVLLAGYVIVAEGFAVSGRVASFTMLDQVRNQAVTRSSLSLYAAGMTPSGGMRLPRDVAVFPIGTEGFGTRERVVLDLTEAQRFTAGVVQARSPTNVEQIAFRAARERLAFSRDGSRTTVVNGLGATIAGLVYREGDTFYSLPSSLAAGAKATLQAGRSGAAVAVPRDLPLSARFTHLAQNQPPGSYIAVLDRSPFVEAGVPNVAERGSFHLVLGWPGGQP